LDQGRKLVRAERLLETSSCPVSSKKWGGFCFIKVCQRNDRRPRVRVVQCFKNRDGVKIPLNVYNRQVDIIQPESKDLERVAAGTRPPDTMSRFSRCFRHGRAQIIVIRYKQDIRFYHGFTLPTAAGPGFSNFANVIAEIALNNCYWCVL
jgi:hypothetical protein